MEQVIDKTNEARSTELKTEINEKDVWKCMWCGAGKKNDLADPLYCSGKCRGLDGAKPLDGGEIEKTIFNLADVEPGNVIFHRKSEDPAILPLPNPGKASYADYLARPYAYHRRLNAETLNWGEHLDLKQLQQAGLKKNRVAIPGDWDFGSKPVEKTDLGIAEEPYMENEK